MANRDTRPTLRPDVVRRMLLAGAKAAKEVWERPASQRAGEPRFPTPEGWAKVRAAFHAMSSAEDRAICALRLLLEAAERDEQEAGASWNRGAT